MGEIERAIEKLNERKYAMGLTDEEGKTGDRSFAMLMMSGFDLDIDELDHYRRQSIGASAESLERHLANGQTVDVAIATSTAGTWIDGFLTGIILGESR